MGRRRRHQQSKVEIKEENLDRFAGSSDEDEGEQPIPMKEPAEHLDADDEGVESTDDELDKKDELNENEDAPPKDDSPDDEQDESDDDMNPTAKMADVMARILGTATSKQSVVLAKTTTPLQRMQQKEKEEIKAMKEKRQSNRERNLTALHIPLSVATTGPVNDGRLSVTQELEQERLHRRVATRGVVALFNAISQHQKSSVEVRLGCCFLC